MAAKTRAPLTNASGHDEPQTAWAVLVRDVGERRAHQVVFGAVAEVEAAIAAGDARAAAQHDLDVSAPLHYPLPSAPPQGELPAQPTEGVTGAADALSPSGTAPPQGEQSTKKEP